MEIYKEGKFLGNPLNIVYYPDKILTTKAQAITSFNSELKELAQNMLCTMYQAPGIGLAAPQINLLQRIFVLDVDFTREEKEDETWSYTDLNPQVFINPIITKKEGSSVYEEGCLSIPGVYEKVKRAEKIKLEYQNLQGEKQELEASGLLSTCIQHELDHLDGVLFIDYLSPLKRNFHLKKYLKRMKK